MITFLTHQKYQEKRVQSKTVLILINQKLVYCKLKKKRAKFQYSYEKHNYLQISRKMDTDMIIENAKVVEKCIVNRTYSTTFTPIKVITLFHI